MDLPKIPDTTLKGEGGEHLVSLLLHGFATIRKVTQIDYGLDIEAELLKDNSPTGRTFCVQVKFVTSTPRLKQETKNSWKQRVDPVFVLWIKSESPDEKPSYEKANSAKRYFRRFPSRLSLLEEKTYKEYDEVLFQGEINKYWDEFDKKWNKVTDDKKPVKSKKNLTDSNKIQKSSPSQALELIKGIEEAINTKKALDDYQQIRLFLFSTAQLYRNRIPSEIIGNHEIQLLYTYKEKVKLSAQEVILIARTIVGDKFNLKAGWYWVKFNSKLEDIVFITEYFIKNDLAEDVVIGSIQLLGYFWDDRYLKFFDGERQTVNENIKVKELEICSEHPSIKTLEYCQKYLNESEERVKNKAQEVYTSLITKLKPHDAVTLLKGNAFNKYKIDSSFYSGITEAELRNLMSTDDDWIRVDIIKELAKRKVFLEAELLELIKDKNWNVRYIAVKGLLDSGYNYEVEKIREILRPTDDGFSGLLSRRIYDFEEDDLYTKVYSKNDLTTLKTKSFWGFGGEAVYETISIKDPAFVKTVREDLINDFENRKNELLSSEAKARGVTLEKMQSFWEKYNPTVKGIFLEKGLKILLDKGEANDRKIAYRFINNGNYSIKSLSKKLLLKYAQSDDIPTLLDLAKKEKDSIFLQKAIELSDKKEALIKDLVSSDNEDFSKYALEYSIKNKVPLNWDLVERLLKTKNEVLRRLTVLYIYENLNRVDAKKKLKEYYSNETYFYNVVSLLDILLFSPPFLRVKLLNKFKKELLTHVN